MLLNVHKESLNQICSSYKVIVSLQKTWIKHLHSYGFIFDLVMTVLKPTSFGWTNFQLNCSDLWKISWFVFERWTHFLCYTMFEWDEEEWLRTCNWFKCGCLSWNFTVCLWPVVNPVQMWSLPIAHLHWLTFYFLCLVLIYYTLLFYPSKCWKPMHESMLKTAI